MITESGNFAYSPVPKAAERLFRMCWQLEDWLRTIVYVELRAQRVDWETPIRKKVQDWPPYALSSDKRLHHMATSHQAAISYLTFSQLWDVISSDESWELFAPYLPPKENVSVKIAEIKTIRNRTAHFRDPHPKDTARLELFMDDMEPGIRRFCNRYTQGQILSNSSLDPVSTALKNIWEDIGYGIELMYPHGWLYAPGHHRMEPLMNGRLDILTHQNYSPHSFEGIVYRVTVHRGNRNDRYSDTVQLFDSTRSLHNDIIHFLISSLGDEVSVTIPAILGVERTTELVSAFLRAGLEACCGFAKSVDIGKLDWPEYVLWPNHMLNIFCDEIQEPILVLE